jgi:hypothetical protein
MENEQKYPSPQCDEACYYHCTKGGQQEPECVQENIKLTPDVPVEENTNDYEEQIF